MTPAINALWVKAQRLTWMLLIVATTSAAPAATADDFIPELLDRLEQQGRSDAFQWLRSQHAQYPSNPLYHDWVSRFAMESGDYRRAIPSLERLIALQPNHLGARLDLILALQLEGRSYEARQQLQQLYPLLPEAEALPEQARLQIAELDKLLQPQRVSKANRFTAVISAGIGHDSNANRGADSDTLKTYLNGIPVELQLDPRSVKTADEFNETSLHLEYGKRGNDCRFEACRQWQAGAYQRHYRSLGEYDQRHIYLATRKSYAGRYQREYGVTLLNVVSSKIEYIDHDKSDEQNIIGFDYRQRLLGRGHLTGAIKTEWIDERQRDERNSFLTTLTLNGQARLNISPSFKKSGQRLRWEAAGSRHRRPDYFAGDTTRYWLSATYPFMVGQWHSTIGLTARWRQDDETFNQLFFGSTVRRDHEWQISAQLQRVLGKWIISSRANYEQISSNIDLFDTSRFQASLTLAYQL